MNITKKSFMNAIEKKINAGFLIPIVGIENDRYISVDDISFIKSDFTSCTEIERAFKTVFNMESFFEVQENRKPFDFVKEEYTILSENKSVYVPAEIKTSDFNSNFFYILDNVFKYISKTKKDKFEYALVYWNIRKGKDCKIMQIYKNDELIAILCPAEKSKHTILHSEYWSDMERLERTYAE